MKNLDRLLGLRLIDMRGEEFLELAKSGGLVSDGDSHIPSSPTQAIGIAALAKALGCSSSQIYILRRDGILDDAIISRIGRNIIFDVDRARELANGWMNAKQSEKRAAHGRA